MSKSDFSPVKSADRVFDILEELIHHPHGITTHELGKRLGIAASSIHALIQTMVRRKYAKINEERKITLGTKFYEFAARYSNDPLLLHAKPVMKSLARQVNENIHLAVLDGLDIVYIACEQTTHPVRYHFEIGQTQKAYVTGVGKMLLSQYSDKAIRDMFASYHFEKLTEHTIDSVEMLAERLELIRRNGYSLDDSESYVGAKCYAAPIYDANGAMIASISISIPFLRADSAHDDAYVALIKEAGRQISALFGDR
ncbi:Transcriptional regulator KdgR [Paenibacillus konkukensis]|uniref:Transcriptional regulator KdgR n=1 Tax=Paenibacillus konkukensis TaxID=2020716 RepID=A0ABY4RFC0_9BACL|nr:IclR family transcriptional regulator [Paenibacillus konkukensis]UQZ81264.1 Transcriptional regulator KdgR [Paenibacillus konkukensis]